MVNDEIYAFLYLFQKEVTMLASAKVFETGNSQVICLPEALRVKTREVWISRNDITGQISIQPKPSTDE